MKKNSESKESSQNLYFSRAVKVHCEMLKFKKDESVEEYALELKAHFKKYLENKFLSSSTYRQLSEIASSITHAKEVNLIAMIKSCDNKNLKINLKNGDTKYVPYADVVLIDSNKEMVCLPLANEIVLQKLKELGDIVRRITLRGFFLPVLMSKNNSKNIYENQFYIVDIKDSASLNEAIYTSQDEKDIARDIINQNKTNLPEYIFSELVRAIGMKNIDKNEGMKTCLKFTILQALSDDELRGQNGGLHSFIIGPPSIGKGKINKAVHTLNVISTEAQAGKMSIPGISGSAKSENGVWKSIPGLIPLATSGAFTIQDSHSIGKNQRDDLFGICSKIMEDGTCIDSTSAKTTFITQTRIHLDANRKSDLVQGLNKDDLSFEEEYQVPFNILSRFCFVYEFNSDPKLQFESAMEMLTDDDSFNDNENACRKIKLIISTLKNDFKNIEIGSDVTRLVVDKFQVIYDENKDVFTNHSEMAMFQTRTANSILKLLTAIARVNGRNKAIPEDIDYAFSFIYPKFKFLNKIVPKLNSASYLSKAQQITSRRSVISQKFKNQNVTVDEIVDWLCDNAEGFGNVSERTIYRDLQAIAKKLKHNEWYVN